MSEGNQQPRPIVSRQRIEIAVACITVLAFLVFFPLVLGHACSGISLGERFATYNLSTQGKDREDGGATNHKEPVNSATTIPETEARSTAYASPSAGNKPIAWWSLFWCDVRASDYFIGLFTLVLAIVTYFLWRETERLAKGGDEQAAKLTQSILQAARSATAMEGVAAAMEQNVESVKESVQTSKNIADRQKSVSEMQLRAYINAVIGNGIYQERKKGLKFEGRVLLVNEGPTPAHKVTHIVDVGIFPIPLPKKFEFPNMGTEPAGENMIGPRQNRSLSAILSHFVADDAVEDIKIGKCQGLYVWGKVNYEDAFGQTHQTDFCHLLTWLPDGNVWGYYIPNRNTAT